MPLLILLIIKLRLKGQPACVLYVYSYINNTKRTFYANIFNFRAVAIFSLAVHPVIYYVQQLFIQSRGVSLQIRSVRILGGYFFLMCGDSYRFSAIFRDLGEFLGFYTDFVRILRVYHGNKPSILWIFGDFCSCNTMLAH